MTILTGIDLPPDSPGGSVELLRDLYGGPDPLIPADVFMLARENAPTTDGHGSPALLPVTGKAVSGPDFWSYVDRLGAAVRDRFAAADPTVLHLQHLAFGATAALQQVFPDRPSIALVHGTDLLFAADHPTQAAVLRETAASADAVVVPTTAMADRLRRLTSVPADRIVHIPWGVPDRLLAERPARPGDRTDRAAGALRVLYAGRLTAEKATSGLIEAVTGFDGVELSVAAPRAEFTALAARSDLTRARYLGWLSREELWREFGRQDLLIVPSLRLEAFGLVTIEAQACGLPVAYQPVPGLTEVLGRTALPIDFGDLTALRDHLKQLAHAPERLAGLAAAGLVNSARFPLSRTATTLAELSDRVRR
ncbi:glycosyltransferase family 4 protein [Streptomyces sp. CBMA123]|uniref:glycosyltransferase family 4 protein n=1 Tax=Streptomyces sp. CBMA123 TaxID=1896313 RepID=UPI0016619A77|nr:glycosyltransferase family 4 protein [Streptomyces sp. CBMA123]MBD0695422.1 glycosyltransferase [Streptomyces sp. CBMA123]